MHINRRISIRAKLKPSKVRPNHCVLPGTAHLCNRKPPTTAQSKDGKVSLERTFAHRSADPAFSEQVVHL